MSNLILHKGGWEANRNDLAAVPVPPETESYMPIPYPRILEEIELQLPRFKYGIERERWALARDGNQMFGVLTLANGNNDPDWSLAMGIRSSYDSSLSVGLCMGSNVFVCDNLAFNGQTRTRKHTLNLFRDLPKVIYDMMAEADEMKLAVGGQINAMKKEPLTIVEADHLIVESVRRNVLPASSLPKVIEQWEEPKHEDFKPRTRWSLYNAFTEVMKTRSPENQIRNSLKLSELFQIN